MKLIKTKSLHAIEESWYNQILRLTESPILLTELGERVDPFIYTYTLKSPSRYRISFSIPNEETGEVTLMRATADIVKLPRFPVADPEIEIIGVDVSFATASASKPNKINNTRQPFKIMSTVVTFLEELLRENPEINAILYKPTDSKRARLYEVYLQKAIEEGPLKGEFKRVEIPAFGKVKLIKSFIDLNKESDYLRKDLESIIRSEAHEGTSIDYSQIIVKRADFSGLVLTNAILNRATLSGSTFKHSNLTNITLTGAILEGVDFSNANLTFADLSVADCQNAIFNDTTFNNTILKDALFQGADLSGSRGLETCIGLNTIEYDRRTIWPEGFDITEYQN